MRLLCVFLCLLCTSCATIINGPDQEISVNSEPAGAHIAINGQDAGITPAKFRIKRAKDHVITLSMEGYHTHDEDLTRELSAVTALYILPGGLVSMAVDSQEGAIWCFQDAVNVELKELFDTEHVIAQHLRLLKQLDIKNEC